ncbi:MAG: hypothetical protein KGH64_02220 [Candidatus Micrarchaeota archaeon]|nr:hypothetical protein [Candidatus Micrarchaeota archaeon]
MIALGGNAISGAPYIDKVAQEIVKQYLKGNRIVITHGNGPQVGALFEKSPGNLSILTMETEVQIGMQLKRVIEKALKKSGKNPNGIVKIVKTKVIVDKNDNAFHNPTKPIGRFLTHSEANKLTSKGLAVKKLIGGYRHVVPSPIPKRIVQIDLIRRLMKSKIVIACGGGGAAVTKSKTGLTRADAVIDKDRVSALLAKQIDADILLILTNVDGAFLNYGKSNQRFIAKISANRLHSYAMDGQFEEGSMKPKVEACIDFVKHTKCAAVIGNLSKPANAFSFRGVTMVA